MLMGLCLGTASFGFAFSLDPSPAKAIPVSLNRKEVPGPKNSIEISNADLNVTKSSALKKKKVK